MNMKTSSFSSSCFSSRITHGYKLRFSFQMPGKTRRAKFETLLQIHPISSYLTWELWELYLTGGIWHSIKWYKFGSWAAPTTDVPTNCKHPLYSVSQSELSRLKKNISLGKFTEIVQPTIVSKNCAKLIIQYDFSTLFYNRLTGDILLQHLNTAFRLWSCCLLYWFVHGEGVVCQIWCMMFALGLD